MLCPAGDDTDLTDAHEHAHEYDYDYGLTVMWIYQNAWGGSHWLEPRNRNRTRSRARARLFLSFGRARARLFPPLELVPILAEHAAIHATLDHDVSDFSIELARHGLGPNDVERTLR